MKKFLLATVLALGTCQLPAQNLLPQPTSITFNKGNIQLKNCQFKFSIPDSIANPLRQYIRETKLFAQTGNGQININFELNKNLKGYKISITPQSAHITASNYQGFANSIATLRQLEKNGKLVCCEITDYPALSWRGAMLDVSRHFFPISFLKKQIDLMSSYKLNSLHLHLTDAAGWRMEIKQYPRLTQLAAWRKPGLWKPWWNGGRQYVEEGTEGAYGGYYTQDELRELVAYAARRGVNIVPEIEMPAHSEEVLTAYPQYSCTHELYKQADFCPGNDSTFVFLKNVLNEVMQVFPSPYIHIGGDEAGKASWKNCPLCQKRMKDENLKDLEALQGYLIRNIATYLKEKGRHAIGWDEILSDTLCKGTGVMVWRDAKAAQQAAERGHHVILSPGSHYYFDGYQDAPPTQPEAIGGYLTLERVYSYNPLSALKSNEKKLLTGIQGNLWTEYVPTENDVERMLYPRLLAIAETGWNGEQKVAYPLFKKRALNEIKRLKAKGVNAFDLKKEYGQRKEYINPIKHLALGKKVTYNVALRPNYAAQGETTLTDGLRGGWSYGDKRWQGFIGHQCLDVTIDLEKPTPIKNISADFMQSCGPEIYFPVKVTMSVSNDGNNYTQIAQINTPFKRSDLLEIKPYEFKGKTMGRFVRVQAETGRNGGWLFTDEIIIK